MIEVIEPRNESHWLRDRLMKRVARNPESGCWEWTGMRGSNGYGLILAGSRSKRVHKMAHRVSYEIFVGPVPDGHVICHKCDNPACVYPPHLFSGTQSDNLRDMKEKNRRTYVRSPFCWRGHSMLGENIYIEPKTGRQQCRACRTISARQAYLRQKGKAV